MSQEILEKLNSIAQQVDNVAKQAVKNGTLIAELQDNMTGEFKDVRATLEVIGERVSEMGPLQYELHDYGKRIDKLEMKVSRAKF